MSTPKEYQRLPGSRFLALYGRHSLWKAADHVLFLANRGFTEEYRRFYFADIQTIYFRKTATGNIVSLCLGAFVFLLAAWAFRGWRFEHWEEWGVVTVSIITAILFLFLLVNVMLGPTCKSYLRTAVQLQDLPSLTRVRRARKAIRILQPLIEGVQGALAADQLSTAVPDQAGAFSLRQTPGAVAQPLLVHDEGKAHLWLSCALILHGICGFARIQFPGMTVVGASTVLFFGVLGLTTASLIKQRGSDLSGSVKRLVYWVLAMIVIQLVSSGVYGLYFLFSSEFGRLLANPHSVGAAALQSPKESLPLLVLVLFTGSSSLIAGFAGVLIVQKMKRIRAAETQGVPAVE